MKYINLLLLAILSIGTVGNKAPSKTEEKFPPSVANYDGTDYAGYTLNSGNIKTFSAELDLRNSDLETPIVQFVITPSKRGDGNVYTPDFENLTFTFTDTENKTMTISFSPRKADAPKYYYINAMAMGENQTLLGEHQGNYKWALDPEDGAYITDVYSAISPYTFDGYGADYSWFKFYDKNGNTFESGCNGVISIYYDIKENALYSDTGFQWVDDDPNNELTLKDKYTLSKSGERRYRIRDLDKDDYLKGSNVISTVWSGFDNPKNVTFKASFSKVITEDPSILLVTLGGNSIVENYYLKNYTKAVKNVKFSIPKPLFFSKGNSYDFANGGKVKIEDFDGNTILSETAYTNDLSFTPSSAGTYTITYSLVDPVFGNNTTYKYSLDTLESGGTTLKPNALDREYVVNEIIDAGCSVYNNVQEYLPSVSLTIEKNGLEVYSTIELDKLSYRFESEGEYTFKYRSIDLLGRTTEIERTYSVSEYCLKIKDGLLESVVVSNSDDITRPLNSDFYILNVVTGKVITPSSVSILLSKDGGEFKTYDKDNRINGEGTYIVKYIYNYSLGSVEGQRKFLVFKELPTISVNDVPKNSLLANDSSIENDTINVVVLKGSIVLIPKDYFNSNYPLTVEKYEKNGSLVDCTEEYKENGLTITFDELKEYIVSAKLSTENGFIVRKNIVFNVKEGLVNFTKVDNQVANVGHEIELVVPEARDFYNNLIENGTFTILFNGKEIKVENSKFTPENLGTYKITYNVTTLGYTEKYSYEYKIIDDEAPVITVSNVKNKARVGKFIKIEGYSIQDNSNDDIDIKIFVTYKNESISIYNGGFDCAKSGDYVVTIIATDMVGNSSTKSFTITAGGKGCSSSIVSSNSLIIVSILCIATSAICYIKRREQDIKNLKEN